MTNVHINFLAPLRENKKYAQGIESKQDIPTQLQLVSILLWLIRKWHDNSHCRAELNISELLHTQKGTQTIYYPCLNSLLPHFYFHPSSLQAVVYNINGVIRTRIPSSLHYYKAYWLAHSPKPAGSLSTVGCHRAGTLTVILHWGCWPSITGWRNSLAIIQAHTPFDLSRAEYIATQQVQGDCWCTTVVVHCIVVKECNTMGES